MRVSLLGPDARTTDDADFKAHVVSELAAIRALLERRESSPPAARHARLLAALAEAMEDLDLPFDAGEVLAHSRVHHELAEALRVCGLSTSAGLGALFRSLRDRPLAGLRLVRDERTWRLERCT